MIERKFIKERVNDYLIQRYLESAFKRCSYSHTVIQKTPLGEKLVIFSARPGLIVGRGGSNIKNIVTKLKEEFGMQSPQVEVQEVSEPYLDPFIVAEQVADELVRLGKARFKFIGHNAVQRILDAGALGAEVKISGQIPSKRAKAWRFIGGYLPKCGNPSDALVIEGFKAGQQKLGTIGVTVKILPPGTILPDSIAIAKKTPEEKKAEEERRMEEAKKANEEIIIVEKKEEPAIEEKAEKEEKGEKKKEKPKEKKKAEKKKEKKEK